MTIRKTFAEINKPLTPEQIAELEALRDIEPEPDEDAPELTAEQIEEIRAERRAERNKQPVTLRLSPAAIAKAKGFGKGYTSILSRLLENALNDTEALKKAL